MRRDNGARFASPGLLPLGKLMRLHVLYWNSFPEFIQFTIGVEQRDYSWTQKLQKGLVIQILLAMKISGELPLGAIFLTKDWAPAGVLEINDVQDGQQRILTICLFLRALQLKLERVKGNDPEAQRILNKIEQSLFLSVSGNRQPRIVPRPLEVKTFNTIIDGDIKSALKTGLLKKEEEAQGLTSCFYYFQDAP